MAQASFGRKGLAETDDLAAKRQAFIAAERARGGVDRPAPAEQRGYVETPAARAYQGEARPAKSLLLAYVLWWFGCIISAHRFYLGAWRSALVQSGMLFGGAALVGIAASTNTGLPGTIGAGALILGLLWMLGDVFLIPGIRRRMAEQQRAEGVGTVFA